MANRSRSTALGWVFSRASLAGAILVCGQVCGQALNAQQARSTLGADPRVSPDGRQILFTSDRDSVSGVYVMRLDGSSIRRVTPAGLASGGGSWSPDGRRIVYTAHGVRIHDIASGRDDAVPGTETDLFPTWSADGRWITVAAGQFPNTDIYVVSPDGAQRRRLSSTPGLNFGPAWSPDGERVAYVARPAPTEGVKIFVMDADGSHPHQVSSGSLGHEHPAWSPDGTLIAFHASARGRHHAAVYVVNVTTGEQRLVTTHTQDYLVETPTWLADGKRLAVQSDRDGPMAVYVIDLAGNVVASLTPPGPGAR